MPHAAAATATPYKQHTLPGQFEAEDFDAGGEGAGYHDNKAGNNGGKYRPNDSVDIIDSRDSGGGYVVQNFETGEWLGYTVDVAQCANYQFALRASSNTSTSAFHIEIDGRNVTGPVTVPSTGNFNKFQWINAPVVALSPGRHQVKIVAEQQYFNLNRVEAKVVNLSTVTPSTSRPVPGVIEAENFNPGGEGQGYHDNAAGNAGRMYRPNEGVDIISTSDSEGGAYDVNNFETGEWLAYSINVAQCGDYELDLRASTAFTNSAYRIEVDGRDVTGRVDVPSTGGWHLYQWIEAPAITLSAGYHLLRVVAEEQYFNLNRLRLVSGSPATPTQPAIPVPGRFEAEAFDLGGEGIGYHDNVAGNAGGQYRTNEGVDIISTSDSEGGAFDVNNFETGEWLAYTVDATAGSYKVSLRAASGFNDSGFRVLVDGVDRTGKVTIPNTGSWSTYQWVASPAISLTAGRHVLKVVSAQQYFNVNRVDVGAGVTTSTPTNPLPTTDAGNGQTTFSCSFDSGPRDCGFQEQAKVSSGRASLVSIARDGSTGVRLHTEPGDNNVAGSGAMERNDLWLTPEATGCRTGGACEGVEQWWAHSVYLPSDFQAPTWHNYVLADFHNSDPGPGQANFHVAFERQSDTSKPGLLAFVGYGGQSNTANRYSAIIGLPVLNQWYDFVYHVKWSSGSSGYFDAWVNGVKVLSHRGPTLYAGQGAYLKLANYHLPICNPYPACVGTHRASSVIHDRVRRGTTALSVARGPLEGVLQLVNGQLVPVSQ